uniref:sensor histidine kinase n=1 Tax=Pontiella sp. TaxID=2837462 RepID=UPI0035614FCE
ETEELAGMLSEAAEQLVEEITAQRVLALAESGKMQLDLMPVFSAEVLLKVMRQLHSMGISSGIALAIDPAAEETEFRSDPVLVRRVLLNLVKNAMEASEPGGRVMSCCYRDGDEVCFTVHNSTAMPAEVQRQVFTRSFSTKGAGRGLGTYGIRLITEHYLRGSVSFVSAAETGTTFTLRFPVRFADTELPEA